MSRDTREILNQAQNALDQQRTGAALQSLWTHLDRSHLQERDFIDLLRTMARAFSQAGRSRAVATIQLYLGQRDAAWRASEDPRDRARVMLARDKPVEAAKLFEEAGWFGHAAIELENAGQMREARVLWERLADDPKLRADLYTQGLVRFNLGRACAALDDHEAARRATVQSMHLLEAAADGYETRGLRERAFDCFQILLTLGRKGAFENLAEGYLNCIRILKEDNLKYYVLQYYEDFQELAVSRAEHHAASTLFREAAEFCRRFDLPYEAHYRNLAAQTQVSAAQQVLAKNGTPEMAENAYAASIDLFNDLGCYSKIREVYVALSKLELGEKRRARYLRLSQRLAGEVDAPIRLVPFPDYLKQDTAYPEIWRLDVIEWEHGGDAAETMAEVLQDSKWPEYTRRRALLCRLHQLSSGSEMMKPDTLVGLAQRLGKVEIYAALAPLEALVDNESAAVRAAVQEAARQLFFKRSFVLITQGLEDENATVRRQALEAVGQLHFGHAFDPLQRIYRTSTVAEVRQTALSSIGRIPTLEAAEMLIDALRQGSAQERQLVRGLLIRAEQSDLNDLLKRASAAESGANKEILDDVLRQRRAF